MVSRPIPFVAWLVVPTESQSRRLDFPSLVHILFSGCQSSQGIFFSRLCAVLKYMLQSSFGEMTILSVLFLALVDTCWMVNSADCLWTTTTVAGSDYFFPYFCWAFSVAREDETVSEVLSYVIYLCVIKIRMLCWRKGISCCGCNGGGHNMIHVVRERTACTVRSFAVFIVL